MKAFEARFPVTNVNHTVEFESMYFETFFFKTNMFFFVCVQIKCQIQKSKSKQSVAQLKIFSHETSTYDVCKQAVRKCTFESFSASVITPNL